jgi:hypothetical protein
MMEELVSALKMIGGDLDVRVVILAANGPVFSSGHDLHGLAEGDIRGYRRLFDVATELMLTGWKPAGPELSSRGQGASGFLWLSKNAPAHRLHLANSILF